MPWRDIVGLLLVVLGALALLAGIAYAFVLAPLATGLIVGGCVAVLLGALVGRYDPDRGHVETDGRSVDQPQPEQAA